MRLNQYALIAVISLASTAGLCGDRTTINLTNPSPVPDNTPKVTTSKIEFRVSGNANSVRVKFFTPSDGIVQTVTTLPFTYSFNTTQDELFLSLDVTPITYDGTVRFPFLSAQIFVNGNLFREATSTDILLNTLSISGNWRR